MRIVNIKLENYGEFEEVNINFGKMLTIDAKPNNDKRASFTNVARTISSANINNYCESNIPNVQRALWLDKVYNIFESFFSVSTSASQIEKDLLNKVIPLQKSENQILMNTTNVYIIFECDCNKKLETNNLNINVSDRTRNRIKSKSTKQLKYQTNKSTNNNCISEDDIMILDREIREEHSNNGHNNETFLYLLFAYEIDRRKFKENLEKNYEKLKKRFMDMGKSRREIKVNYLKELLVKLYVDSIEPNCYLCNDKCQKISVLHSIKSVYELFCLGNLTGSYILGSINEQNNRFNKENEKRIS